MTDRHGHRAHWSAALLIAPGAAAIFGATTSWALQVTPPGVATAKPPVKAPVSARVVPDRDFLAAHRTIAANQRSLVVMRVRVKDLRRQLTALAKPLPALAVSAGSPSGQAWAGSSGGSGGNARAQATPRWATAAAHSVQRVSAPQAAVRHAAAPRASAPRPAAPPAAAPPVHAVTGAS